MCILRPLTPPNPMSSFSLSPSCMDVGSPTSLWFSITPSMSPSPLLCSSAQNQWFVLLILPSSSSSSSSSVYISVRVCVSVCGVCDRVDCVCVFSGLSSHHPLSSSSFLLSRLCILCVYSCVSMYVCRVCASMMLAVIVYVRKHDVIVCVCSTAVYGTVLCE